MKVPLLNRRRALVLGGIVITLGIVFLAGPRVSDDLTIHLRSDFPDDLRELRNRIEEDESSIGNVKETARKRITFFQGDNAAPEKTRFAVVAVHGFSTSRGDTAPWAEQIANELGANLFETRVTGHGLEDSNSLLDATASAWLSDSAEAIEIGRKLSTDGVIVLGTSTGATALSWILCQEEEEYRRGVVAGAFLSPNFGVNHPDAHKLRWPWAEFLLKAKGKQKAEARRKNVESAMYPKVWYTSYPTYSAAPTVVLAEAAREAPILKVPVWIGYSKIDAVVLPWETEAFFDRQVKLGAKLVKKNYGDTEDRPHNHMFIGDILAPGTTGDAVDAVLGFLVKHEIVKEEEVSGRDGG